MSKDIVELYTDGACSGNPGKGGWGAILRYKGKEKELSGYDPATTNNRMELLAVIRALQELKRPVKIELYTDSQYVKNGINEWIDNWQKNGWRTANKKPVKNVDLWQELLAALAPHDVNWHWVKGHNGHPENERADELARRAIENANPELGA